MSRDSVRIQILGDEFVICPTHVYILIMLLCQYLADKGTKHAGTYLDYPIRCSKLPNFIAGRGQRKTQHRSRQTSRSRGLCRKCGRSMRISSPPSLPGRTCFASIDTAYWSTEGGCRRAVSKKVLPDRIVLYHFWRWLSNSNHSTQHLKISHI